MAREIIIVDDDKQLANLLELMLEPLGFTCRLFFSVEDFYAFPIKPEDIILLDLIMPDVDGVEVIRELAKRHCAANLILMSGYDRGVLLSVEKLAKAHALNVSASLCKPVEMEVLRKTIIDIAQQETPTQTHPSIQHSNQQTLTADELRVALIRDQIHLHYQPQVELSSHELTGVEALVRWQHPERGLIYPDQFISIAEQHKLMDELTARVIKLAIKQGQAWKDSGLSIQISINVSADNITSLALPERLTELLHDQEMDATLFMLEITETALMGELLTSLDILTRLRMKGFGLSIDDFGTGYSSLSQLHKVPFNELKIDKSFIMSMQKDEQSRSIVKTCIILGHELGMEVVAEGVESEEIIGLLKEYNCDIVQGYYIARPMSGEQLLTWLQQRNK